MNGGTALFTIIAKNYLPYARVLMRSVAEHHPDWRRFVILVDRIDGYFDPAAENFELVTSSALRIPKSRWFHFKYSILELSTAVKPYAFEYLFEMHKFDRILYLDPDIKVFSPLCKVTEALESANLVLTPHLTASIDDGKRPAEIDILRSGAYNLGFIGIRKSQVSAAFLDWWQQKLYDHCVVDLPRGLFVDQRWVDLVPGLFDGVAIVRDPGYNVAYWNLNHRVLSRSGAGYRVANSPLAFFHFSGYDADQPEKLSRHQNRHKMVDLPDPTRRLIDCYGAELNEAGYAACRKWPYAFSVFDNGTLIPDMCRPIQHESPELVDLVQDPFSDEGFKHFLEVWNSPVQESAGRPGISRLAYRIYRTRTDVQSAMPDIFGGNYRRFLEWMLANGKKEHGLGQAFLTTIADAIRMCKGHKESLTWPEVSGADALADEFPGGAPEGAHPGASLRLTRLAAAIYQGRPELQRYFPDPCGSDRARFLIWLLTYGKEEHHLSPHHLAPLREQWRSVLGSLPSSTARIRHRIILRGMAASVYARTILGRVPVALESLRRIPKRTPVREVRTVPERTSPLEFGVNLVGYFRSETGVGQSARAAYRALQTLDLPVSLGSAGEAGPCRNQDRTVGAMSGEFPYSTNLFHVNADQSAYLVSYLGEQALRNRRNIGYWAWELEEFPDRWIDAFSPYQEVWTPSAFCRDAIGRKATVPVFVIPHAISPVVSGRMDRQSFGLSPDRFIFLAAFDVLSVIERKNPLAAVRAFQTAFGSDSRYQLVLKINNAAVAPKGSWKHLDAIRSACSSAGVQILDETISREEMYALTRCADCIVSLHRSEGFGLLIAEAMYFAKPVIVTNYSGNTDFTRPDNSMLVNYRLVPVGPDCQPYDSGNLWAEPDVEQAASHMKSVVENGELRARLSGRASDFVRDTLNPQVVGQMMRRRLEAPGLLTAAGSGARPPEGSREIGRSTSAAAAAHPPHQNRAL